MINKFLFHYLTCFYSYLASLQTLDKSATAPERVDRVRLSAVSRSNRFSDYDFVFQDSNLFKESLACGSINSREATI